MQRYNQSVNEVLEETKSQLEGLKPKEVELRQAENGFNELKEKKKTSTWELFIDTLKDPMVIVLLLVAFVQLFLGEFVESLVIFIVLMINSVVAVVQTKRAESSLDALRQMSAPSAKVLRNGEKTSIPARELVVGDIVSLEAGDFIPADGRLIDVQNLRVEEGMLTGESEPVEKFSDLIEGEAALGDRKNMVFSSSLVVYGRADFVVTAIAEQTEIGKIAQMLETAEAKQTPLQQKLEKFGKQLGWAILALCALIFAVQILRLFTTNQTADMQKAILDSFMFAVAVAVAAIPEALSSVVTIVLSVGTNKMAKQHAIMRNLPAVETLGSTSIICTDKTGTLTQNKMTVVDSYLPTESSKELTDLSQVDQKLLLNAMVLCNDSSFSQEGQALGDPTEVALIAYSDKIGHPYQELREKSPRLAEFPFDSERKLMSTINDFEGQKTIFVKGGPDVLFNRCNQVFLDGKVQEFTPELKEKFQAQNEAFSQKALRVLAYAYKPASDDKKELTLTDENDLILIGLSAMIDPPREAVYDSIAEAKKAGIKTIMITGDHKTTAQAIAKDIGLMNEGDMALTGQELDALTEDELRDNLQKISVYARVSPENKIRIVRAWQNEHQVTAMTGDGVNDAPALKQANIGIAMGSGTDVAKDASSMILTDDNFVSIVSAVSIGRVVYDNIKKSISYLFSGNLGAIIAIVFALIVGWVNPFTALQLLFINLVNDSVPAIALGMEKAEPDVMEKAPRQLNEGIFANGLMRIILIRGSLIGIAAIISQYVGQKTSPEMGVAMAFTTLILARTLQTFAARSNSQNIFKLGFTTNKYVLMAVTFCLALYSLTTLPFLREIFSIPASFGWSEWAVAGGLAVIAVICMEILKSIKGVFEK
ncbi:MAG: cation-translocating P-type ATPase [Lactococcus cremoris]|jgi:calcium-translocating P-type ATPase|uniref:P-type Ca(2+) transporter n=1 Tax=Lactococcus cremoris subsp. cremoris IBB477 TaxID=1449093 RepID=A0A1E7G493_LACLC|nr:cation-translocating P-type ATPase [Lactococcus cremoris]MCI1841748.1 cation-translocating P-type ATPase [Lactococcus lactis]KZK09868.1 Calcium-transporting ATPase [Lactococcus cremoris]MCT0456782.1 calcium-translocating P-type ATPase, PMCA-type [Lactococcus cremoris]MCT0477068.1 calcium-translocating P-type ATPase, PMCA-type [Lactococcus cremoris]MCT0500252.1 calcium-translocating P-type ATPase, PMCA-type [Lactococcus cremoris]